MARIAYHITRTRAVRYNLCARLCAGISCFFEGTLEDSQIVAVVMFTSSEPTAGYIEGAHDRGYSGTAHGRSLQVNSYLACQSPTFLRVGFWRVCGWQCIVSV